MKLLIYIYTFLLILALSALSTFSQEAPQGINYQAVARDFTGEELTNQNISVRLSIISGSPGGLVEWVENHSVTTNRFGLFNLVIGQGTREGGDKEEFSAIKWGLLPHYLKVAIKFQESGEYLDMGTAQFFSVPYAIYAEYAASGSGGGGGDPDDRDKDPTNEIQNLSLNIEDDEILLTLMNPDGSEQSSLQIDYDPDNEIQDLALNNNVLTITKNPDANPISLTPYLDDTDDQTLFLIADSIGISGGNKISLEMFYDNTDNQTLTLEEDSIRISGGNKISLEMFYDNTDNQTLTLEEDSIRISGGNAINITELKNPESIYFYANRTTSYDASGGEYYTLKFEDVKTNEGSSYNPLNGEFTALINGLYSFNIVYLANESQSIFLYLNGSLAETFVSTTATQTYRIPFMRHLNAGDEIEIVVYNKLAIPSPIGTGTFGGFKVY